MLPWLQRHQCVSKDVVLDHAFARLLLSVINHSYDLI